VNGEYNEKGLACLGIFSGFDWSHDNEDLIGIFGSLDNGKLNLIHEKSLRKHVKMVELFQRLYAGDSEEEALA